MLLIRQATTQSGASSGLGPYACFVGAPLDPLRFSSVTGHFLNDNSFLNLASPMPPPCPHPGHSPPYAHARVPIFWAGQPPAWVSGSLYLVTLAR